MTFSEKVKTEWCGIEQKSDCCKRAQAYGMALFGKSFSEEAISLHTIHKQVADCYADLLVCLTGCIVTVTEIERDSGDKTLYLVEVEDREDRLRILEYFGHTAKTDTLRINRELLENDCCKRAFLRGSMMVCASITDPMKEYHMECVVSCSELAEDLAGLMGEFSIRAKITTRKENFILYLKESETIEDLLTLTGAVKNCLELMDVKILKNVRNKVNRVTNCETANIGKTVAASSEQVRDIEWIIAHKGIHYLSDELQVVANLRLENPELSLAELCEISNTGLSKSGMNHRLKKISEIAAKLRGSDM